MKIPGKGVFLKRLSRESPQQISNSGNPLFFKNLRKKIRFRGVYSAWDPLLRGGGEIK